MSAADVRPGGHPQSSAHSCRIRQQHREIRSRHRSGPSANGGFGAVRSHPFRPTTGRGRSTRPAPTSWVKSTRQRLPSHVAAGCSGDHVRQCRECRHHRARLPDTANEHGGGPAPEDPETRRRQRWGPRSRVGVRMARRMNMSKYGVSTIRERSAGAVCPKRPELPR